MECGAWRLLREVGRGAYGAVHFALGPNGERVAVKVCRRDAMDAECYARELRGAKLYMSVSAAEGLVRMREVAEEAWGFYAVMDLADDEFFGVESSPESYRPKTLAKVIEGEKALPLKDCVRLGIELAGGLATLQRHHLLHRDIKPGNVIYVGGRPVLSDPGLLVEEAEAASFVGTPGYVPPEKFTEAASDIYSLGLTLKAASFGRRVEDLGKGPAMEADTGAALFPEWWRILNRATDPTPSRRHQSAKALLRELQSLRRRMALAALAGSRCARAAAALLALCVVAVSVFAAGANRRLHRSLSAQSAELRQLKQFKADEERRRKREERGKTWRNISWDLEPNQAFWDFVKLGIANVSRTNQVRGAEMRLQYGRLEHLYRKKKELLDNVKALFKAARKKGLENADEEFFRALRMDSERKALNREIDSIRKGFGL